MSHSGNEHTDELIQHLFRNHSGKLTAILMNKFGFQFTSSIEDAIQETFISALRTWPTKGLPDQPEAWLNRVASNKLINEIHRNKKTVDAELPDSADEIESVFYSEKEIKDDQLRLLYAFCIDSIPVRNQVILTLKSLGGLSVKEIASAFLMTPDAVKKTITRSRSSIKESDIKIPLIDKAQEREEAVLLVLYLMFNEGYTASDGEVLIKDHLCLEALRLGILIAEHADLKSPNVFALVALMYFNMARFNARLDADEFILDLKEQDRSEWSRDYIVRGFHYLKLSRSGDKFSRYHIEAGIASVHCEAPTFEKTNWKLIAFYYEKWMQMENNSLAMINYVIAISYLEGAEAGLQKLDANLTENEKHFDWYHATKADIYFRMGNYEKAKAYYSVALDEAKTSFERKFIEKKLLEATKLAHSPN